MAAALFVLVAALVFLVALGGNRPPAHDILVQRSLDTRLGTVILLVVLAGASVLAFGTLAYVLLGRATKPPSHAAGGGRPALSWWAKAVTGVVLAIYVGGWTAVLLLGRGGLTLQPGPAPLLPSMPGGSVAGDGDTTSLVVSWWVLAAVVLLVLAVLALLFYLQCRRRQARVESLSAERRDLRTAIEASLKELDQTSDCRGAVIRAYATMERVLAEHGLARYRSEAPFEYLSRWTSALQLGRSTAGALTGLYEWAKFSPHSVDEVMERRATEALVALRSELEENTT